MAPRASFPNRAPSEAQIASRCCLSSKSNAAGLFESTSRTAITVPSGATMGTTISETVALEQAMWPGNSLTSSTSWVCLVDAAAPHTPLEKGIVYTPMSTLIRAYLKVAGSHCTVKSCPMEIIERCMKFTRYSGHCRYPIAGLGQNGINMPTNLQVRLVLLVHFK